MWGRRQSIYFAVTLFYLFWKESSYIKSAKTLFTKQNINTIDNDIDEARKYSFLDKNAWSKCSKLGQGLPQLCLI